MLKIKNKNIYANLQEILVTLREELYQATKILYFQKIKKTSNGVLTNCWYHGNGQEKKPSMGIRNDGLIHCFTCNTVTTLDEMISNCFGHFDNGKFGLNWLTKHFKYGDIEEIELLPSLVTIKKSTQYVSEEELSKYRYYHPYMYKRGLTDELIDMFDIGYDANFKLKENANIVPCITFPIRNKQGKTLFVARRSVEGKMFHYPADVDKPVYGIYELFKYTDLNNPNYRLPKLIVCESMFNAITCWKYGVPAVALLGTGTNEQYKVINRLPVEHIYLGFDPDDAGLKATQKFIKNVKRSNIHIYKIPNGKDLNDLTEEEFKSLQIYEIFDDWVLTFTK